MGKKNSGLEEYRQLALKVATNSEHSLTEAESIRYNDLYYMFNEV